MTTQRVAQKAKIILSKWRGKSVSDRLPTSIHDTPVGSFPRGGPQPSRIPVVLYYLSCVFCVIGILMVVQVFRLNSDDDRKQVLITGMSLGTLGIILAVAMNLLNNRENRAIISYVTVQAEAMKNDHNSRQIFNESAQFYPPDLSGPNGIK